MKLGFKPRVHTENWSKPSKVALLDGSLRFEFDPAIDYSLFDSYSAHPHVEFLNAVTDTAMVAFARAWGPLWREFDEWNAQTVTHSLAAYQAERRWLAAVNGLVRAVDHADRRAHARRRTRVIDWAAIERKSLAEYFEAEVERNRYSPIPMPDKEGLTIATIRQVLAIPGSLAEWVDQAKTEDIRYATDLALGASDLGPQSGLTVVRGSGEVGVDAGWKLRSLGVALRWMVWYDVYRRDPIYCCDECGNFFQSKTKRWRKFCNNGKCAKRATDREWRRQHPQPAAVEAGGNMQDQKKGDTRAHKTR